MSNTLFFHEFMETYEDLENHLIVNKLPTLKSLKEYAQEEKKFLKTLDFKNEVEYWKNQLYEKLIPTLLGILKTGASYVPLDPKFPEDRLRYMYEKVAMSAVICDQENFLKFKDYKNSYSFDELVKLKIGEKLDEKLGDKLKTFSHQRTCYVLFTSGSTGNPKGVEVTHKNVINFLHSMTSSPGIKSEDKLLSVTTISFDISVLEIFLPLINGASVYLASESELIDGESLKNILTKEKINIMQATPATWRLLINSGWTGDLDLKVLCGGEPLQKDLARKLVFKTKEVWNMYGPTETTVWSSLKKISVDEGPILVGKPVLNTDLLVLNEKLEIVEYEEVGNIYIGGIRSY